jgi:hypothetical protein
MNHPGISVEGTSDFYNREPSAPSKSSTSYHLPTPQPMDTMGIATRTTFQFYRPEPLGHESFLRENPKHPNFAATQRLSFPGTPRMFDHPDFGSYLPYARKPLHLIPASSRF